MAMRLKMIAGLGFAMLSTTAAVSQAPDAPKEEQIVVQGERKEVIQKIRQLIARNRSDQLARFEEKVCPMVIGMPRDYTATMTRLIRENIESVKAKADKPDCRPNALVIFIDRPVDLVKAIYKEDPALLNMAPRTADNFIRSAGPIMSWHVSEMMGADGEDLQSGEIAGNTFPIHRTVTTSMLNSGVAINMRLAMVVIEKPRTEGKTLRQLADLATMHMLLEVKQSAAVNDPNSILALFEPRVDGSAPPPRLSSFDRAALKGFYTQRDNDLSSRQQRLNIANTIKKESESGTNRE